MSPPTRTVAGASLAPRCHCRRPVPYQDAGEWAGCAKCGRWLAAGRAAALGADLTATPAEQERTSDPRASGAVLPPDAGGPEPIERACERGPGRPRSDAPRPSEPVVPSAGSGPTRPAREEGLALALWLGDPDGEVEP